MVIGVTTEDFVLNFCFCYDRDSILGPQIERTMKGGHNLSHPRKGCVLHLRNSESLYIITTSPRRRESGLNDVLLDTLKRISCLEVE